MVKRFVRAIEKPLVQIDHHGVSLQLQGVHERQQLLDLAAEVSGFLPAAVVERLDRKAVSAEDHAPLGQIRDRECPISIQSRETFRSEGLVDCQYHFRIAVASEW